VVRNPLTPEQIEAGRQLGLRLRTARGDRGLDEIASAAGISPETLRKIETGRLPSPAFGTVACLSDVLGLSLEDLATAWREGLHPARRLKAVS
jgi:transcriptional regulator with XRE-family HTH domain